MKGFITVLTAAIVLLGSIQFGMLRAGEKKGEKAAKTEKGKTVKCHGNKKAPTEMTLSGKVEKTEKKNKKGESKTHYFLTDAAGSKIMLCAGGKCKGKQKDKKDKKDKKAVSVNLDEYVGKEVTIVGKGFQKTWLVEITKIEAAAKTPAK